MVSPATRCTRRCWLVAGDALPRRVLRRSSTGRSWSLAQIIVYTGAIMMLFLFVLMLVGGTPRTPSSRCCAASGVGRGRCSASASPLVGTAVVPRDRRRTRSGWPRPTPTATSGHRAAAVRQVRVRLRGDLGAADHRGDGRDDAGPRRAATQKLTQRDHAEERIRKYAGGDHPGPRPAPGVWRRHNVGRHAGAAAGRVDRTDLGFACAPGTCTVFPKPRSVGRVDEVRQPEAATTTTTPTKGEKA